MFVGEGYVGRESLLIVLWVVDCGLCVVVLVGTLDARLGCGCAGLIGRKSKRHTLQDVNAVCYSLYHMLCKKPMILRVAFNP